MPLLVHPVISCATIAAYHSISYVMAKSNVTIIMMKPIAMAPPIGTIRSTIYSHTSEHWYESSTIHWIIQIYACISHMYLIKIIHHFRMQQVSSYSGICHRIWSQIKHSSICRRFLQWQMVRAPNGKTILHGLEILSIASQIWRKWNTIRILRSQYFQRNFFVWFIPSDHLPPTT